jgi:hypothetical protein
MISCTIIVTDANALTRPIHDRMPVVVDKVEMKRRRDACVIKLTRLAADSFGQWRDRPMQYVTV